MNVSSQKSCRCYESELARRKCSLCNGRNFPCVLSGYLLSVPYLTGRPDYTADRQTGLDVFQIQDTRYADEPGEHLAVGGDERYFEFLSEGQKVGIVDGEVVIQAQRYG